MGSRSSRRRPHLASIAAVLAVVACAEPRAPAPTQESPVIPQDLFARVNGVTLHYLDWGGAGDLLLMLPGWSHTAHTWAGIAPAFTDRYRVMSLTRRGHGASEKADSNFSVETLVEDIVGFVDAVGAERVVLVGSSFAGREMPLASRRLGGRAVGLVFIDAIYDWPAIATAPGSADIGRFYRPPDSAFRSREALTAWFRRRDPESWNAAQEATLRSQTYLVPDGRVAWQMSESMGRHLAAIRDRAAELSAITVPTLALVANQGDRVAHRMRAAGYSADDAATFRRWAAEVDIRLKRAGVEALKRSVPDARIVELDALHIIHWDQPDVVIREMNRFLNDLVLGDSAR